MADMPHRYEDIAKTLGYSRVYFSTLLTGNAIVTEEHIKLIKLHYRELLDTDNKRIETEDKISNYDALLSVLISEVASLCSKVYGEHPEVSMKRIRKAAEDVRQMG